MDEAQRLKVLIESNTNALDELRRWNDPATTKLIQELEQARAQAVAQLAHVAGRFPTSNSEELP